MKVIRRSVFSGELHSMELDVSATDLERWLNKEDLIQNIFPNLSAEEREFLISGCTPEEWEDMFGEEDINSSTLIGVKE